MKKKDIFLYLSTFIFLAVSFIFFLLAFIYVNRMSYYIYATATFVLFCVLNKITAKKIECPDGYNLVQAYLFYKKCLKNGIQKKPDKLTQKDLSAVKEIAERYDYCKDFDSHKLRTLYCNGYEASKIL